MEREREASGVENNATVCIKQRQGPELGEGKRWDEAVGTKHLKWNGRKSI